GDALHSLLGYAERPTVLQAVVWASYVAASIFAFIRIGHNGVSFKRSNSKGGVTRSDQNNPTILTREN
ncbi:MAG: hypothetical protein M1305_00240, partial [Candidatus Marsarchaeota archaeon]|nr:hypothetical protein [Candidatus Marsarchaeota archaeon]